MSNEKPHFLVGKFQNFQRSIAKGYLCPVCAQGFQHEPKLWHHAKTSHPTSLGYQAPAGEDEARKLFSHTAMEKAQKSRRSAVRSTEPMKSEHSSNDEDSVKPNGGDGVRSGSPSRPFSAPGLAQDPAKMMNHDIEKLSISRDQSNVDASDALHDFLPSPTPFKRGAGGDRELPEPPQSQSQPDKHNSMKATLKPRHKKALSGGPWVADDPDFNRENFIASHSDLPRNPVGSKRLFDPSTDNPNLNINPRVQRSKQQDNASTGRRAYDPRLDSYRSKNPSSVDKAGLGSKGEFLQDKPAQQKFISIENPVPHAPTVELPTVEQDMIPAEHGSASVGAAPGAAVESQPTMVRQPDTRPISHDQLVVEVKGIYAGLSMVESKCIDVDEKQSAAAQNKDPSRQTNLSNEQWQALITLHKTLLYEHHDFFLASQHPSASHALSRLAAKYSMPARMWRHGIHAFLEVLRHRLPDSLDHMLAFIYIAYSMMALLYETVPTFEDTWIECLGDLGRYRMAIEDDDIRDREVWSGVARFWYSKAADKSPNIGRLYHHLAILARPCTLQQLSLYSKSLTCIIPFDSARGSIMTLFAPVLDGKESVYRRSSSLDIIFIKAHGILFTGRQLVEFDAALYQIKEGLLDSYIGRATTKFKEQGVFVAITNIAALFQYGDLTQHGTHKSILRLAFIEAGSRFDQQSHSPSQIPLNDSSNFQDDTSRSSSGMSNTSTPPNQNPNHESSRIIVSHASKITFTTLKISLQRAGDRNVYPLVHVSFVFLWSLASVEKAMAYIEKDVPWEEICLFLNALAKPEVMSSRVLAETFPKPSEGIGRPLPEDFNMRGQIYSQKYFPQRWFSEAMVDDEERSLELPSMAAPRVERILWLGIRIASFKRWITYDKKSRRFLTTQYGVDLVRSRSQQTKHSSLSMSGDQNHDNKMADDTSPDPNFQNRNIDMSDPQALPNQPSKSGLQSLRYRDFKSPDASSTDGTKPHKQDDVMTDVSPVEGDKESPLGNSEPTAFMPISHRTKEKFMEATFISDPSNPDKIQLIRSSHNFLDIYQSKESS